MQAMKCEICGSNEIVKQEGLFVCQHCGTKYSIEEAKKLIGTVKIDKSDETQKFLVLARRAGEEKNYIDANKYYERVMQEDPDNWEAYFYQRYYQVLSASKSDLDTLGRSFPNSMATFVRQVATDESISDKLSALREMRTKCITLADHLFDVYKETKANVLGAGGGTRWMFEKFRDAVQDQFPQYTDFISQLNVDAQTYTKKVQDYTAARGNSELARLKAESGGGGCYIATCVYGSYDCPQEWTLRRFRDNTLAATWYGRAFIRIYYAISPKLVTLFGNTSWFKRLWRGRLDNLVVHLRKNGISDNPYTDK